MGRQIDDAVARARMISKGVRPDDDAPFMGVNEYWSGVTLCCGKQVVLKYASVVYQPRKECLDCGRRTAGMTRMNSDADARKQMIDGGIRPDADIPYPGSAIPWLGTCMRCGARVAARYDKVVGRGDSGCWDCGRKAAGLTMRNPDADARSRMIEGGVLPDADVPYPGGNTPWLGTCLECGGRVSPMYNSVVNGGQGGCKPCADKAKGLASRHPDAEAREQMIECGILPNFNIPYPGSNKHWPGTCQECGRRTRSSYHSVVIGGHKGCTPCSRKDSSSGFNSSKPSFVYFLRNEQLSAVKIGIANIGSKRLTHFNRLGWRPLKIWNTEDGYQAWAVERQILDSWRAAGIPLGVTARDMQPYGGANETAPLHMVDEFEVIARVGDLVRAQNPLEDVA